MGLAKSFPLWFFEARDKNCWADCPLLFLQSFYPRKPWMLVVIYLHHHPHHNWALNKQENYRSKAKFSSGDLVCAAYWIEGRWLSFFFIAVPHARRLHCLSFNSIGDFNSLFPRSLVFCFLYNYVCLSVANRRRTFSLFFFITDGGDSTLSTTVLHAHRESHPSCSYAL